MRQFSQLLDGLVYTRSSNGKLDLIARYMREAPDPDRGWALAALTGNLDIKAVKASAIGEMIRARTDPVLYEMSRDYVGDLAETVALLWPKPEDQPAEIDDATLTLSAIVDRLHNVSRAAACPIPSPPWRQAGCASASARGRRMSNCRSSYPTMPIGTS